MFFLYAKVSPSILKNKESIIELIKGSLRYKVNKLYENEFQILSQTKLREKVSDFIKNLDDFYPIRMSDSKSVIKLEGTSYLRIMNLLELEDMFRQEAEYWVIRNKFSVYVSIFYGGTVCIFLTKNKAQNSFLDFRAAEKFINEKFNSVERIRIAESLFAEEDNLVALYKIK